MAGNSSFFYDLKECNFGHIMSFGDGVSGKILRRGSINQLGLPYLKGV